MAERLPLATKTVEASSQVPGYNPIRYSAEDFGGGIGRALEQFGATGQQFAMTLKAAEGDRKANDAYANLNAAKDENRVRMLDPNTGILSKTAGNAKGSLAEATAVTDDIRKRYLEKIEDPETREAWAKMWDREAETTKDQAARHELSQLGAYKANTEKATLISAMNDAYNFYNDPKKISEAIDVTRTLIQANSLGADPQTVAIAETQAVSQIHLAAISRWATEDPSAAMDYYKSHKDEMTGPDHVEATKFIQPALDLQKANQWVASHMGQGGQTTVELYSAVQFAESSNNPNAVSPDGAVGLMQLLPDTARYVAKKLGMADVAAQHNDDLIAQLKEDPELNQILGRAYLDEQLQKFGGDVEAALVAYNAGPGRAEAFLNHNAGRKPGQRDYNVPGMGFLEKETRPYVEGILGAWSGGQGQAGQIGAKMTPDNWQLKNFSPADILAPTEGGQWVNSTAALSLDSVADDFAAQFPGVKIKINEINDSTMTAGKRRGTSDPKDNPHVENSQHVHGTAFDVQIQGMNDVQKAAFLSLARQKGFKGIGFYGPNGHLHIDMGNERTWGPMPAWARDAMKVPVGKIEGLPAPSYTADFGGAGGTGQAPGAPGSLYAGNQAPAMNEYIRQANQITDPGVRSHVLAELSRQSSLMDDARKAQDAAAKQTAWDTVIQGSVKDIPPHLLSALEPSFVNSLRSYEEGRDKPGGITTDWQKFSQVSLLAGTNPDALLNMDVYSEFRANQADEQFNQILTWQRAAADKKSGNPGAAAVFGQMRTRADLINDTQREFKWKENDPRIAELGRKLDDRMAYEGSLLKRELNAVEMQDIIDKLMIQDIGTGVLSYFGGQGAAFAAQDPAVFIAAETWDTVQPDDQAVLIDNYELYYQQTPDQEAAVDLYNRAMQVYLGAKPTGPEDEQATLRAQIEQGLGRPLVQQEFEHYYGKWLLTFLGRKPVR